jgi:hypothetical protein
LLLFAVKAMLQLRQDEGADLREVVDAAIGDASERSEMETLACALIGDMAFARTLPERGTHVLEPIVALFTALISLENMTEEHIDELLVHAEALAKDSLRAGSGYRLTIRGIDVGPWDHTEQGGPSPADLIDLGGLRIPREAGLSLRMDKGGDPPQLLSLTVRNGASTLRLQGFRSPDGPRWEDVMARLAQNVRARDGEAKEWVGRIGPELRCVMPAEETLVGDASKPVLMLGCDGPNWLLRGIVTGADAESNDQYTWAYSYFERVVVVPSYVPSVSLSPAEFGGGIPPAGGPILLRMPM